MSRSWHGKDKNHPMVRMWLHRDAERLERKTARADKELTAQEVFELIVEEIAASRPVHCYLTEQGDVRIVTV